MPHSSEWRPTLIDIEAEFTTFVPTFRGGKIVRDLIPDQSAMPLNADFYFPDDNVVVEMKRMEADSHAGYHARIVKAFAHFGHTGSETLGFLFRGEPMPEKVAARLSRQIANPLRTAVRKANRQIAATKRHLNIEDAFGLAIFANDKNFGVTPASALSILSNFVLALSECHIDGFVYTTPNVYHDTGDHIARCMWVPLYSEGKESLSDFVNALGSAWVYYTEKLGDPYLERYQSNEYDIQILMGQPIERFRQIRGR